MKIFRGFHHPGIARACALTIGNFDGVHRGHQAMLALVNNEAVGRPMTFIAGLEIRENYESLPHLRRWAEKHPEVQQIYYVTGNVDLLMIITAENLKEYDAITERLMAENPQVLRINTNVVIDAIKVGLYVPVD